MINHSTILWLGLAIITSGVLFDISYQTQSLKEELTRINRSITAEREAIRVLRAEWTYLNRPSRLRTLSTKTDLQPIQKNQIITSVDMMPIVAMPLASLPGRTPGENSNRTSSTSPSNRPNSSAKKFTNVPVAKSAMISSRTKKNRSLAVVSNLMLTSQSGVPASSSKGTPVVKSDSTKTRNTTSKGTPVVKSDSTKTRNTTATRKHLQEQKTRGMSQVNTKLTPKVHHKVVQSKSRIVTSQNDPIAMLLINLEQSR